MRMNGLLSSVTTNFKNYHFTLINLIEDEDEKWREKVILTVPGLKVIEFYVVDRLGKLMAVPHKTKPMTALDVSRNASFK